LFSGLSIVNNVSFVLVFFEGVLSFFSPCVIPLIPVYISYLAGNGKIINEDGTIFYKRKKVLTNTLFFIAGISSTFLYLDFPFLL
jgi:cytochrome c-type biogenesis protein